MQRTTITLDDDLAAELKAEKYHEGIDHPELPFGWTSPPPLPYNVM